MPTLFEISQKKIVRAFYRLNVLQPRNYTDYTGYLGGQIISYTIRISILSWLCQYPRVRVLSAYFDTF